MSTRTWFPATVSDSTGWAVAGEETLVDALGDASEANRADLLTMSGNQLIGTYGGTAIPAGATINSVTQYGNVQGSSVNQGDEVTITMQGIVDSTAEGTANTVGPDTLSQALSAASVEELEDIGFKFVGSTPGTGEVGYVYQTYLEIDYTYSGSEVAVRSRAQIL